MNKSSSEAGRSGTTRRIGQACDRCRKKKLKCDGGFPKCQRCDDGGHMCEESKPLQRKTKVRGFISNEQRLEQLQEELSMCQQLLESEKYKNSQLQEQIDRNEQTRLPQDVETAAPRPAEVVPILASGQGRHDDSRYIIKHMGRMVYDEQGIGRFAGSTTGVHFVLSVEKECQRTLKLSCGFPESCFRLFLLPSNHLQAKSWKGDRQDLWRQLSEIIAYPLHFYHEQVEIFIKHWEAFCPVLLRNQAKRDISLMFGTLHNPDGTEELSCATAMALLMIICINEFYNRNSPPQQQSNSHQMCLSTARDLVDIVSTEGSLGSLQALALFALYSQLSGHTSAMTRVNGLMVRLAQSLGLHRHARRFKMRPGEIELRKRLWWYTYTFDTFTSLLHGLPASIDNADVDNDIPIDCYLHDLDDADLTHPLPGEKTAVFVFIQYSIIGRIFSRIRRMLYTTTQRRDGAAKIKELELEVRMWNQNLKLQGLDFDIGVASTLSLPRKSANKLDNTTLWLQLLANVAIILIHRPGLSFDDSSAEFRDCLQACVASSSANLIYIDDLQTPIWLQNMSMMTPGMIFQSALTHVYFQCHTPASTLEAGPLLDSGLEIISKGTVILERNIANQNINDFEQPYYRHSISEVVAVLNLLRSLLSRRRQILANTESMLDYDMVNEVSMYFDESTWSTNAIDTLNYISATDWAYETPGPFMGFPSLAELDQMRRSPLGSE